MLRECARGPFEDIPNPIHSVIDELLRRGQYTRFCSSNAWQPDVNLYETADSYLVCCDLAGMKKAEIEVTVHENRLVVRGQRLRPLPPGGTDQLRVHVMEINAGEFSREVEIPEMVRQDAISAEYRDGLLWVTLPKQREAMR